MKLLKFAVGFVATLVLCSLVQQSTGQQPNARTRDREALLRTDVDFAKLSAEKGSPEAFAAYLSEDALQLPAGGNPIEGKQNILQGIRSGNLLTWQPMKAEVANSGELGWTWGTFELHTKDAEGKPVVRYGKYVNLWRKQHDGTWRVILDMGNASPPPSAQSTRVKDDDY